MPRATISFSTLSVVGVFLLLPLPGKAWAQERVAISGAINPQATGVPPGRTARPLVIGQEVVYNERITTNEGGQTQLLFLDESSMSIGPNSDLTIDKFVYNPGTGTGELAMTTTKGILRFVGGKLSKQDKGVVVRTNSATLAVRGGAFLLDQQPNGSLRAVFIHGNGLTVTGANGISQTLQRPGFAVAIAGPGASPSSPFQVSPGQLAQLLTQLDGRRGASGGARIPPTNQNVAESRVDQTISANVTGNVQQAQAQAQTQTQTASQPSGVSVASVQTATTPQSTTSLNPITPTLKPTYSGVYKTTPGTGSAQGFVSNNPSFNIEYGGGQIDAGGFYTAQLNGSGIRFAVAATGGFLSYGSVGTQSPFGPISGTSFLSTDRSFLFSNDTEVNLPAEHSFIFGGMPVNASFYQPTGKDRAFAFTIQPDAALQSGIPFIRNQAGGNLVNPVVSPFFIIGPAAFPFAGLTGSGAPTNAGPSPALQASLAIQGNGPNQSSVLTIDTAEFFTAANSGKPAGNGFLRGSYLGTGGLQPVRISGSTATLPDVAGNTLFGTNSISGFVLDQGSYGLDLNRQSSVASEVPLAGKPTTYGFAQALLPTAIPANLGVSRDSRTLIGFFGGLMYPLLGDSNVRPPYLVGGTASIMTKASDSSVSATFTGGDPFGTNSLLLLFGAENPTTKRNTRLNSSFIDDSNFAAVESQFGASQVNGIDIQMNGDPTQASHIALVTGDTVPASSLLPYGLCQSCQSLKWGYWTGSLSTPDSTGTASMRTDQAHINTWIAGIPSATSDFTSLRGQGIKASYTGRALGSVNNNSTTYLAAGTFTGNYNSGPIPPLSRSAVSMAGNS